MNDLVDVRTSLAVSPTARVEIGRDGILHILAGPVTLHLDRAACEELTTTLARAMVVLAKATPKKRLPALELVRADTAETARPLAEGDSDRVR
jgi:hypothetical protein